jgi:hypothetical protein
MPVEILCLCRYFRFIYGSSMYFEVEYFVSQYFQFVQMGLIKVRKDPASARSDHWGDRSCTRTVNSEFGQSSCFAPVSIQRAFQMALSLRQIPLRPSLPRELLIACTISSSAKPFSVLNRPPPSYPGHVPLTRIERAGLAVGSAAISLFNPRRGGIFLSLHTLILC